MVQWDFSLIKNRAPRVQFPCLQIDTDQPEKIFDQRKIPLHHFTIGFQKPGICADSWFLESNGKMVQWDFSLINSCSTTAVRLSLTSKAKLTWLLLRRQLSLRITFNLDWVSTISKSHTHPSHSETFRLLLLSLSSSKDADSADSARPLHYSTSDSRLARVPVLSPCYSLTHAHRSIGYRKRNPQPLSDSTARLMYLRVYDSRDSSHQPAPSPSLYYSLTQSHRSIGYHNLNPQFLTDSAARLM